MSPRDTTLDVRGLWNNELSLLSPIYRNGGEIDLAARALGSELVIGDDVRLLASGGASMSAAGAVTGGRGGSIALRAGAGEGAIDIGDRVELSAFRRGRRARWRVRARSATTGDP